MKWQEPRLPASPKTTPSFSREELTDSIIAKLNFNIIRNKGSEDAYSRKDIMGYLMNISDDTVEKTEDGYRLVTLKIGRAHV